LVAISMRLPETIFNLQGIFGGLSGDEQQAMLDRSDVAYESGLFAGFAAIALLTAGVWLAGAPAAGHSPSTRLNRPPTPVIRNPVSPTQLSSVRTDAERQPA
jgi:hypothetical protein